MRMYKISWIRSHFNPIETNNKISLSYIAQCGYQGTISLQEHYEMSLYWCSALAHNWCISHSVITSLLRCQLDVGNITPFILLISSCLYLIYLFANSFIIIIILYQLLILIQEREKTQRENYRIV